MVCGVAQDYACYAQPFAGVPGTSLFLVCDGHGLNGGDDALVGELVGGPSAHGSPKGKVKGKAKGEATEPEVKIEGGRRGKKK